MEKTRIIVPHGKIKKIAELFGLNPLTLQKKESGKKAKPKSIEEYKARPL